VHDRTEIDALHARERTPLQRKVILLEQKIKQEGSWKNAGLVNPFGDTPWDWEAVRCILMTPLGPLTPTWGKLMVHTMYFEDNKVFRDDINDKLNLYALWYSFIIVLAVERAIEESEYLASEDWRGVLAFVAKNIWVTVMIFCMAGLTSIFHVQMLVGKVRAGELHETFLKSPRLVSLPYSFGPTTFALTPSGYTAQILAGTTDASMLRIQCAVLAVVVGCGILAILVFNLAIIRQAVRPWFAAAEWEEEEEEERQAVGKPRNTVLTAAI